ncbi:50S ribosomal protein L11 methyltransferase [Maridesulfovibrio hydrothermalis]|uniref:Ribosomal protein L11 methyltransferase n=1 Tax=Maridesulfovibrio hydrothermalis AM13 = DSM 14728 TaxID=1121451 RepID=L0RFF7_9BACT|nr:50S ribosomal protein L11 methyltransferase [Maridesulfovibrio hydrothermalis]CCO24306.1 Ribosomal protein L11 methyltransferase [Maridesulfovibrio hydrothermalis AM13 = DSM 14728]
MAKLLRIQFNLSEMDSDECQVYLGGRVAHGWEEVPQDDDSISYTIHLEDHPLGAEIVEEIKMRWPDSGCVSEEIEDENWGLAWKEFFEPVTCGDFEILPPWLLEKKTEGKTHIIIEPKMAFGTGGHPTTALCLELISKLAKEGRLNPGMEFFDLGTGSAILAIALAKLGIKGVGVDIDPQSIVCARENIENNNIQGITLSVGSADCIDASLKYDLVVANILSGPLIELCPAVTARLKKNSILILSGILNEQAEKVAAAYIEAGLPAPEIFIQGEWAGLLWENTGTVDE